MFHTQHPQPVVLYGTLNWDNVAFEKRILAHLVITDYVVNLVLMPDLYAAFTTVWRGFNWILRTLKVTA